MREQITMHLLSYNYFINQKNPKIAPDFQLIDSGIITSIDIVNLVSFLEQAFDIQVFVEEVIPKNFQTIDSIERFVTNKKN